MRYLLIYACAMVAIAAVPARGQSLTTSFSGVIEGHGNLFEVNVGAQPLTLTSFGLNIANGAGTSANVSFYSR